ncbi:MAG: hypothetical protein M5U28_10535 [Sandaracinaceae bacterium]|nr:hypothetical protein [Sandaracinaceae bacterium]
MDDDVQLRVVAAELAAPATEHGHAAVARDEPEELVLVVRRSRDGARADRPVRVDARDQHVEGVLPRVELIAQEVQRGPHRRVVVQHARAVGEDRDERAAVAIDGEPRQVGRRHGVDVVVAPADREVGA